MFDPLFDDDENLFKVFWRDTELHETPNIDDDGLFFKRAQKIQVIPDPIQIHPPNAPST